MSQLNRSLKDIILDVLAEEGLDSRYTARLTSIAVRGWNVIFREASNEIKTIILTFDNPNIRVIDYPCDYDYYTKIGMTVQCGCTKKILTLSRDQYMYRPSNSDIAEANCNAECGTLEEDCNNIQQGLTPYSYYSVFQNAWRGGQFVGELYGMGGGESGIGSYINDDENKRFVFSSNVPTTSHIVLEYKMLGITHGEKTIIPNIATESMIAWVKWKMLNRHNSSIGERKEAQIRYEEEVYKYYEQQESMTASEILDELYQGAGFIHN